MRHRVAVLHSTSSLAFNGRDPHLAVIAVEQAFLCDDVLFDPIDDAHLDQLDRWRLLVLPACECMSDDQLSKIEAYVQRGGHVLALGDTAVMDERRRRRRSMGLASLLGFRVHSDSQSGADDPYAKEFRDLYGVTPEAVSTGAALPPTMSRKVGQGRIVYIDEIELATPRKFAESKPYNVVYDVVDDRYYLPPRNRAEIVRAVDELCDREIRITGPEWVVCEITYPRGVGLEMCLDIHLVNYRIGKVAGEVGVDFEVPAGTDVAQIDVVSPSVDGARPVTFRQCGNRVRFSAGPVDVYSLAKVTLSR